MPRTVHLRFVFLSLLMSLAMSVLLLGQETKMTGAERRHAIAPLRKAYAAFNRNEISATVSALDPGIEWCEPMEFPGGGIYHGRDEVARYLSNSRAGFAEGSSQPESSSFRAIVWWSSSMPVSVQMGARHGTKSGSPMSIHLETARRWQCEPLVVATLRYSGLESIIHN